MPSNDSGEHGLDQSTFMTRYKTADTKKNSSHLLSSEAVANSPPSSLLQKVISTLVWSERFLRMSKAASTRAEKPTTYPSD